MITRSQLLSMLTKYGGLPAKEAALIADDLDDSRMQVTTLDADAVRAMAAAPPEIVTTPGAGLYVVLHSLDLKLAHGGTNDFTEAGDNLQAKYTDDSGTAITAAIETTGFIDASGDAYAHIKAATVPLALTAAIVNQPIVLDNTGSEFAGNAGDDNSLIVTAHYSIRNA